MDHRGDIRTRAALLGWPPEVEAAEQVVIDLEARHLRAIVLADRAALDELRQRRAQAIRRFEAAKRAAVLAG